MYEIEVNYIKDAKARNLSDLSTQEVLYRY